MFKLRAVAALSLMLAVGSANAQTPSDKLLLRLHVRPGQAIELTTVTRGVIKVEVPKMPMTMQMGITEDLSCLVTKVAADGSATMATSITSLQDNSRINGKSNAYPSGAGPEAAMLKNMVGMTIATTTNPLGKVTKIEGLDEMADRLFSQMPSAVKPSAELVDSMKNNIKKMFGDKSMMEGPFALGGYPVQPLSIGDSWVRDSPALTGAMGTVKATMTLKARRDGVARIAVRMDVAPVAHPQPIVLGKFSMTMSMSMHGLGIMTVDEATGLTIGGDFNLDSSNTTVLRNAKNGKTISSSHTASKMTMHMQSSGVIQPGS